MPENANPFEPVTPEGNDTPAPQAVPVKPRAEPQRHIRGCPWIRGEEPQKGSGPFNRKRPR